MGLNSSSQSKLPFLLQPEKKVRPNPRFRNGVYQPPHPLSRPSCDPSLYRYPLSPTQVKMLRLLQAEQSGEVVLSETEMEDQDENEYTSDPEHEDSSSLKETRLTKCLAKVAMSYSLSKMHEVRERGAGDASDGKAVQKLQKKNVRFRPLQSEWVYSDEDEAPENENETQEVELELETDSSFSASESELGDTEEIAEDSDWSEELVTTGQERKLMESAGIQVPSFSLRQSSKPSSSGKHSTGTQTDEKPMFATVRNVGLGTTEDEEEDEQFEFDQVWDDFDLMNEEEKSDLLVAENECTTDTDDHFGEFDENENPVVPSPKVSVLFFKNQTMNYKKIGVEEGSRSVVGILDTVAEAERPRKSKSRIVNSVTRFWKKLFVKMKK